MQNSARRSTLLLFGIALTLTIVLCWQDATLVQLEAATAAKAALQTEHEAAQQQLASAQADVTSLREAAASAVPAQQASAARIVDLQMDLAAAQRHGCFMVAEVSSCHAPSSRCLRLPSRN